MTTTMPDAVLWPNAALGWRRLRLGLLTVWVILLALVPILGAREAPLTELRGELDAGRVASVQMTRALPDGATGYATVQLSWQDGWIDRATSVVNVSDSSVSTPTPGPEDVVVGDLEQQLHGWDTSGSLRVLADDQHPVSGTTLVGWHVPAGVGAAGLGLWVLTLWLLYVGPQTWRATRWAWFWMMLGPVAVVGVPLFLSLGGPIRRAPRTRDSHKRLTGGWAFLLAPLVAAAPSLLA
ncbi:MAG: hypothetical protein ABI112_03250 [Terracoccus sp.]